MQQPAAGYTIAEHSSSILPAKRLPESDTKTIPYAGREKEPALGTTRVDTYQTTGHRESPESFRCSRRIRTREAPARTVDHAQKFSPEIIDQLNPERESPGGIQSLR